MPDGPTGVWAILLPRRSRVEALLRLPDEEIETDYWPATTVMAIPAADQLSPTLCPSRP